MKAGLEEKQYVVFCGFAIATRTTRHTCVVCLTSASLQMDFEGNKVASYCGLCGKRMLNVCQVRRLCLDIGTSY